MPDRVPLPRSIRVGYMDYEIHAAGSIENVHDADAVCHATAGKIIMETGKVPAYEGQVLLHEVLHAVWFQWALREGLATEEDIVDRFSKGLAQVIRDNPDLVACLQDRLKP